MLFWRAIFLLNFLFANLVIIMDFKLDKVKIKRRFFKVLRVQFNFYDFLMLFLRSNYFLHLR